MQVYIVTGGYGNSFMESSTETLEKDGGSAWKLVASLPSFRWGVRGLGLDHGRFMVTGECWTMLYHHNITPVCTAGGQDYAWNYFTDVLIYNSEDDEWTTVDHLSTARGWHGMSLVPANNTVDFCL